jgi:hypothetical protein
MDLLSSAQVAPRMRRLTSVQWNREGCRGFAVQARADIPRFHDGMIRRALLRGSLMSKDVDDLDFAINRELWQMGYAATVRVDPVDNSLVVEVSRSR